MRNITVKFTHLQKAVVVEGNINTLGELKEALKEKGISDFDNITFMERNTRSTFSEDDSVFPATVTKRDGTETADLVFSASLRAKFENGASSRRALFVKVKELGIEKELLEKYRKPYTCLSNVVLEEEVQRYSKTETVNKFSSTEKENKEEGLEEVFFQIKDSLKEITDKINSFSFYFEKELKSSYSEEELDELFKD